MEKITFKKISIIMAVTVIVGSLYLYQKNDTFEKKEKCATVGNSYLKEELRNRNYTTEGAVNFTGNPKFAYNRNYNSCFYLNDSHFSSGSEIVKTEYYIINLTTNEKVASYTIWDKGYDDYSSNEIYIMEKKEFDSLNKEIFEN